MRPFLIISWFNLLSPFWDTTILIGLFTILELIGVWFDSDTLFSLLFLWVTKVHPSWNSTFPLFFSLMPLVCDWLLVWNLDEVWVKDATLLRTWIGSKGSSFNIMTYSSTCILTLSMVTIFEVAASSSNINSPLACNSIILSFKTKHFYARWLIKWWYL